MRFVGLAPLHSEDAAHNAMATKDLSRMAGEADKGRNHSFSSFGGDLALRTFRLGYLYRVNRASPTYEETMDTKLIECKLIDVPKAAPEQTPFSKKFAIQLAGSIKLDGQLNPVGLVPNPEQPGRYILFMGRHRFYAIKNVLREQFIQARIFEDMTPEEMGIARIAENIFRNPLAKAQTALAIKKWYQHYLNQRLADDPKPVAAQATPAPQPAEQQLSCQSGKAPEPAPTEPAALTTEGNSAPEKATGPFKKPETEFDQRVAETIGQSVGSVRRVKRISNTFTEDQIKVFIQMGTSQVDMSTIARIKDKSKRDQIVKLIACGAAPPDAIKQVMGDQAPDRDDGKPKAEREAKMAAAAEEEPEVSDDEWFDRQCGETAALLGDPSRYKEGALLFRKLANQRHSFRVAVKKDVLESKQRGKPNGFTNLVLRLISISHPKDWLVCGECKGEGTVANDAAPKEPANFGTGYAKKNCPKCYGSGFVLSTEYIR